MGYQKERDEFIAVWAANGGRVADARTLMQLAATQHRLAVARCNGDYPADNGQRTTKVCPLCETCWAPESFRKGVCPDCRIGQRIEALAESCGFKISTDGDPRGYTTKVYFPPKVNTQGRTPTTFYGAHNTWGGPRWGVPVRER
jgi:hypothetical protein